MSEWTKLFAEKNEIWKYSLHQNSSRVSTQTFFCQSSSKGFQNKSFLLHQAHAPSPLESRAWRCHLIEPQLCVIEALEIVKRLAHMQDGPGLALAGIWCRGPSWETVSTYYLLFASSLLLRLFTSSSFSRTCLISPTFPLPVVVFPVSFFSSLPLPLFPLSVSSLLLFVLHIHYLPHLPFSSSSSISTICFISPFPPPPASSWLPHLFFTSSSSISHLSFVPSLPVLSFLSAFLPLVQKHTILSRDWINKESCCLRVKAKCVSRTQWPGKMWM